MRNSFLILALAFSVSGAALAHDPENKRHRRHWSGLSISTTNADSDSCDDHIEIHERGRSGVAYAEESRTLPNSALRVTAARNGSIHVRQWDRPEIALKLCKAATGETDADAKQRADSIRLNVAGSEVTVDDSAAREFGRQHGEYAALILVHVPKGATLNLNAHNGGISLKKVEANVTAETVNGGISLVESGGKLDVTARNGGVKVKDCSGDVRVEVQNGGVSLDLAESWNGAGLSAHTQNGGLKVAVPANFRASLEVELRGNGSMRCRGDICKNTERGWDDERPKYLRIGTNPVIKASTVNGGITITERGPGEDII